MNRPPAYSPAGRQRQLVAIIPALLVAVIFEIFLGHRHDYTGHYLAGYGGTLGAAMVWLRLLPVSTYAERSARLIVPLCLGCILLGAFLEQTAFNIARFDEVDFCNQSLGAVLAMLVASAYVRGEKPPEQEFDYTLITAIFLLGAGGCFAVA